MVDKEFTKVISHSKNDRLRLKIETEKGKVVDIVVQYEGKFDEEWHPIVRYDCSHGFLHRDIMFPGGKKEKYPRFFSYSPYVDYSRFCTDENRIAGFVEAGAAGER